LAPSEDALKQVTLILQKGPVILEGQQTLVFLVGGVPVHDGTSNTFLAGEKHVRASCGDADADGRVGIVRIDLELRDVKSGESVFGFIAPIDGELDDNGVEDVAIVIGSETAIGKADTRLWSFGTELPPR
jgi:hypothetical protein